MTKAKQNAVNSAITSLKQAAYSFAATGDTRRDIAQYILEQAPNFLDEVSNEVKADLFEGFTLRAHELWGQDYYTRGDTGALVKVANSKDADFAKRQVHKGEVIISVMYARSFTGQEFGKLKDTDPALHDKVKAMRERFSKYASNCMNDIRTEMKRIVAGDGKKRAANKAFADWLKETFDTADKRVKVAKERGDESADQVKFRVARDAFWKTYNA